METQNELPENVGAAVHPVNKNYIMFTTFDGTPIKNPRYPEDEREYLDILDMPKYREAFKKTITVMEYEYFQSLVESAEGDSSLIGRMFYAPHTIRKPAELPEGFSDLIYGHCQDFGENTLAIVRFFEYDQKIDQYYPVDVQFGEDGELLQANDEEE